MVAASEVIRRSDLRLDIERYRQVDFRPMPAWMHRAFGSRAAAVTLGTRVYVESQTFDAVIGGSRGRLVAHELRHVDQWQDDGVFFILRYLAEYVRFRIVGADHDAAYRSISYEMDATTAERLTERIPT